MNKPTLEIRLRVRFAWWLAPYMNTLAFMCAVFGGEPDPDKLQRVVRRAVRVEVVGLAPRK